MKKLSLFVLFLIFYSTLHAKVIHVAVNGSDTNDGSEAMPFLTVSKAAQLALAGDTVIIHEGTYSFHREIEAILRVYDLGWNKEYIWFRLYS